MYLRKWDLSLSELYDFSSTEPLDFLIGNFLFIIIFIELYTFLCDFLNKNTRCLPSAIAYVEFSVKCRRLDGNSYVDSAFTFPIY